MKNGGTKGLYGTTTGQEIGVRGESWESTMDIISGIAGWQQS